MGSSYSSFRPKHKYFQNLSHWRTSLVAQLVKYLPAMQVRSLGWEDLLEKGKATRTSILAWRIPWGRKELDTTE